MRPLLLLFLLIPTALLAGGRDKHPDIPAKPYPNSHFALVDSIRIHYRTWNDDLPDPRGKVLLIHGFCGSTFCWRHNTDALATAGYRVVAVDLPGFGYSGRDPKLNQSQSNRARMMWELIRQIDGPDTSKWNIVGHSMGGGAAEATALMNLPLTKSLTIVDGMIFMENDNINVMVVGLVNHPVYRKILLDYAENHYLTFNNLRRELKSTYGFLPDTVTTLGYWEPMQIEGSAETVVNLIGNSKEVASLNARDLSKIPVLVIWGKKDRTIRLSTGKKLKRKVPSVQLEVLPHVRHMPMETNPVEFNGLLLEFLEKNK